MDQETKDRLVMWAIVVIVFAVAVSFIGYLIFEVNARRADELRLFEEAKTFLNIPCSQIAKPDSPVYTVLAHSLAEFKSYAETYGATHVFYVDDGQSIVLYVFRSDGVEAVRYDIGKQEKEA